MRREGERRDLPVNEEDQHPQRVGPGSPTGEDLDYGCLRGHMCPSGCWTCLAGWFLPAADGAAYGRLVELHQRPGAGGTARLGGGRKGEKEE